MVRSANQAFVYVQADDTTFARREINLVHPVTGGWFVTSGLNPGDKLVVQGAQTLLSEEMKSQIHLVD